MSTAPKYPHHTVDDCQQWEGDWELLRGVPYAMGPSPFGKHAKAQGAAIIALGYAIDAAECHVSVLPEIDWIVSNDTVVRPDVTVVCGDAPEEHVQSVPAIVVEVLSPSTRERDLIEKRSVYESAGVPWYLIIDPDADERSLLILELDTNGRYQEREPTSPLQISICRNCELKLDVARFLKS